MGIIFFKFANEVNLIKYIVDDDAEIDITQAAPFNFHATPQSKKTSKTVHFIESYFILFKI